MQVSLDTPLWLAALPVAALVWLLAHRSGWLLATGRGERHGGPRGGGQRAAVWLRVAAVAVLVLALAGPRVGLGGDEVDVSFLVDASDSMGAARSEARAWVERALAAKPDTDRAALGVFGRDARLAYSLRPDPPDAAPEVVVDGSATNLARAGRLGQGAVGSDRRRRVVLVTDGRQTEGDLETTAEQLADAGVGLDVVTLAGDPGGDLLVEEVRAPERVREGEAYDVTAVIRNTGEDPAEAVVTVHADGTEIHREELAAEPGTTEVAVAREAEEPGTTRYEARISSGATAVEDNTVGRTAVRVDGPARVLVHEGEEGDGGELADALDAAGIPVDVTAAADAPLPGLDRLLDYDSVVLADVAAQQLGEDGMATVDAYVRDAGHGLVAVGGESSYGLGGYGDTALEDLLPVYARITDPKRRPPVAEALVVDTSGSMGACHCADPEAFGGREIEEGGVNKTDISREAVARAVRSLEAHDEVGVLAFDTASEWVVPLQQLPSEEVVDEGLDQLHPEGDTRVPQAVREAIDGLADTEARLRHIVLFTDGFTDDRQLVDVAEEAADAGITLSVVATGEGPSELRDVLRDMAEAGGGRYYPGRDLESIPDIIALEAKMAARPVAVEGRFLPVITGRAPATEGLDRTPPLRGYVATTPKQTARTLLRIGEERDPLLATWQAGLGSATAWTSDAAPRWAAEWVSWEDFTGFWADVVKDTFPDEEDPRADLTATATASGLRVRLETAERIPAAATAEATITGPGGERVDVPLERVATDAFEAVLGPSDVGELDDREGVYAVTATVNDGDEQLARGTATAIRSYPAEYAPGEADSDVLARAVSATDGRVDPEPDEAFAPADLPHGRTLRPLWPLLAALALVLAVADVGLRRLRLERADWGRARRWPARTWRGFRARRRAPAARTEEADSLLAARDRARQRTAPSPTDDVGASGDREDGEGDEPDDADDATDGDGDGA